MNLSMKNLTVEQVDDLYGLTLCVAYAIYVEKWQWFHFPESETPWLLLDAPLPKGKKPDKECARYIGDNFWVFRNLPRYHESYRRMLSAGNKLIQAGYGWLYSRFVEEELKSSNHVRLLHCSPDTRCRAILKFHIKNPDLLKEGDKK